MFFTGWNALDCLKGMVSKMDGSILGSLAGAGYFLTYQAVGMFLGFLLLKKEEKEVRILLGSVFGSVLLQWVPAVFSLGMGFNRASHITALIMTIVLFVCVPLLSEYPHENFLVTVWELQSPLIVYPDTVDQPLQLPCFP